MKYSFVIPAYNNRDNLLRALDSLAQLESCVSYEVIVVDDGSCDDTYNSVVQYRTHMDLKVVRLERSVTSCRARARNYGWKSAKGKFVIFIDSDILVYRSHLKELDRYFTENEDVLIIGCRTHIQNGVSKSDVLTGKIFSNNAFNKDNYKNIDYRYVVFSSESFNGSAIPDSWLHAYSCNMAIKRIYLEKVGGFDENFLNWGLEDVELAYRMYKSGVKIVINPHLEVLHQSSLVCNDDINIKNERIDGYRVNIKYFLDKHPDALVAYEDPYELLIKGKKYIAPKNEDLLIEFYGTEDVNQIKENILKYLDNENLKITFNDYSISSNMDCWIQNIPFANDRIFYFPMSKKVDVIGMMHFIDQSRAEG